MKSLKEALIKKHTVYTSKNPFGLTAKDIMGDIAGFPMGVVVRMMEETELQGNKPDVKLFQKLRSAGNIHEGFIWSDSSYDGPMKKDDFWGRVIKQEDFNLFFKQYPEYKKYNI